MQVFEEDKTNCWCLADSSGDGGVSGAGSSAPWCCTRSEAGGAEPFHSSVEPLKRTSFVARVVFVFSYGDLVGK